MLNPVPLVVSWETLTLPVPVLFNVTARVALLPTPTFPKLMLEGLTVSERVTPVPSSGIATVNGLWSPLTLVTAMLPVKLLVAKGENETLKLMLCPAVKSCGSERPLTPKLCPVTTTLRINTCVFPVAVSLTFWVDVLPVLTSPKLTREGVGVSEV